MGFWDNLEKWADKLTENEKSLSLTELGTYFREEVTGYIGPNHADARKDSLTTNINDVIKNAVQKAFPSTAREKIKVESTAGHYGTGLQEIVDNTTYRITYAGKATAYNIYDDFLGDFYFRVEVYTDKYAQLSTSADHKTTITTSPKPI